MKSLLTLSSLLLLGLIGCGEPCDYKVCENEGQCFDGSCICTTWYEGESCEEEYRKRYYGAYNGTLSNPDDFYSAETVVEIDFAEEGAEYILINNEILAELLNRNGEFEILLQSSGSEQVSGSGIFENGQLEFDFFSVSGSAVSHFFFQGRKL